MGLNPAHVSQNLYGDGFTTPEILDRLHAFETGEQRSFARLDLHTTPLTTVEFIDLLAPLKIGDLLYSELIPAWPEMDRMRSLNLTYRTAEGYVTYIQLNEGIGVNLQVHRHDILDAWKAIKDIASVFPRVTFPIKAGREMVEMCFWMNAPGNPLQVARAIDVASLDRVTANYAGPVVEALRWTAAFRPDEDARLFLFNGAPGTGKTHAIRALSWEWRRWAKFHYITDPEVFFSSPQYMFHVLSTRNGNIRFAEAVEDIEDLFDDAEGGGLGAPPTPQHAITQDGVDKHKWTVLVLEDCGELIMADAKDRTGQGLSRLLNMVDGLLGQGMKVLVLITTNEAVDKLNEAVIRAGRCAQQLEFLPLSVAEANRWLKAEGIVETVSKDYTIADLYAIRRDWAPKMSMGKAKRVGFK